MDGSLWMTARTLDGIWESISHDRGKTWSEPNKYLEHISSRHFICRLQSGRLLLVKHGQINQKTKLRSQLSAYLSEDDGKTWIGGLMLDERRGVSYPDGFQAPNGTIFISYDRSRDFDGEILMARFTEKDILARKFVTTKARAKMQISRPMGIEVLREY
jgi:Neuraminidase (sialidase)